MNEQITIPMSESGKLSIGFLMDEYERFHNYRFTLEVDADAGLAIIGHDE